MQVVSAHRSGFSHHEAGVAEKLKELAQSDRTMPAMELTEDSCRLPCGSGKLDDEHAAARRGDSTHLKRNPPPSVTANVMQRQCGEHHIEARIRERQRLRDGTLKGNLHGRAPRFGASAARIDARKEPWVRFIRRSERCCAPRATTASRSARSSLAPISDDQHSTPTFAARMSCASAISGNWYGWLGLRGGGSPRLRASARPGDPARASAPDPGGIDLPGPHDGSRGSNRPAQPDSAAAPRPTRGRDLRSCPALVARRLTRLPPSSADELFRALVLPARETARE